jgi:CRP-like cAMP-binding protein
MNEFDKFESAHPSSTSLPHLHRFRQTSLKQYSDNLSRHQAAFDFTECGKANSAPVSAKHLLPAHPKSLTAAQALSFFPADRVRTLLAHAAVRCFKSGEVIYREGDGAEAMYCVLKGSASVDSLAMSEQGLEGIVLAIEAIEGVYAGAETLEVGAWLGFDALSGPAPQFRQHTMTAETSCTLLVFTRAELHRLARRDATAALSLKIWWRTECAINPITAPRLRLVVSPRQKLAKLLLSLLRSCGRHARAGVESLDIADAQYGAWIGLPLPICTLVDLSRVCAVDVLEVLQQWEAEGVIVRRGNAIRVINSVWLA